jgi:hypothetical protein
MSEGGKPFEERKVDLPEWYPPVLNAVASRLGSVVYSSPETKMPDSNQSISQPLPTAFRELLVHFHRLSTPLRYKIATELKLLRDGDDLPPQQQWDLVLHRARDEGRLADLWKAVAANNPAFANRQNPFV